MIKFILLLTLYNTEGNNTYVLDHDMSGTDCTYELMTWAGLEEDVPGARLSCEIDNGTLD